jgi:hypothetical protein
LPVQAATQSVLVNVRQQFQLQTSVSNSCNVLFFPGGNDTIGFYTNGIGGAALADNTLVGTGFSCLKNPMLTGLLQGTPFTVPEWRPTRLWVRVHNTTIFTSRVGGCVVTRPKGSWSAFNAPSVGPAQLVSQDNLAALPETRFFDFSQMAGPVEYVIPTFPTDLEAFSYTNTRAPDIGNGITANWLADIAVSGQKWAPLNFFFPPASSNQTITFEVFLSYDCKISEALASTSPLATLVAPPPIAAPHTVIGTASAALNAGSENVTSMLSRAGLLGGAMSGMGIAAARLGRGARVLGPMMEAAMPLLGGMAAL